MKKRSILLAIGVFCFIILYGGPNRIKQLNINKPDDQNTKSVEELRIIAWEYILGGKGSYDNLPGNSDGQQFKPLKSFIENLDIAKMKNNTSFNCSAGPGKVRILSICLPDTQYAFYLHRLSKEQVLKYQEEVILDLKPGTFRADWVNPADGQIIKSEYFTIKKSKHSLLTPQYAMDIALRIIKIL